MTRCAVKITRKYFVESLRIVPSKPGIPNCRVRRPARYSMTKNASRSSKSGGWCNYLEVGLGTPYHMLAMSQYKPPQVSCGARRYTI